MRMRRGRAIGALTVTAALLTTAACGGSTKGVTTGGPTAGTQTQAQGAGTKGGTLKIVSEGDVGNLDTSQAYEVVAWTLMRAFTRQLVSYAGDPEALAKDTMPKDDLAASHTVSADGLTYSFTLRDGVHYAGPTMRAIKAADFTYAIKRLCDPNGTSGAINYYTATIDGLQTFCDGFAKVKAGDAAAVKTYIDGNQISGITTPDDKTVVFKLKQKAGDFLNILALPFATPMPEEVVSPYLTDSADFRQHFPSSGPYYLATYTPDKLFDMKRTPSYDAAGDPLRKSYVDEITVDETVGSDDAEFQQIQAGTADFSLDVTAPPLPLVQRLKATNDPTLRVTSEGRNDYLVFNVKTGANAPTSECGKALAKKEVREAFAYAVSKQSAVQVLGGAISAKPTGQLLTSTITGFKPLDPYATPNSAGDPAKAKALLAAAGYPNGLTCTYLYRPKSKGADLFAAVQQDVKRAGITLKGNMIPNKEFYAKHLQKPSVNDWDLAFPGWSPDWQGNAGRSFFAPLVQTNCTEGTTNYGCYSNKKVDDTLSAALQAEDPSTQYAQIDQTVLDDLPLVPMVERSAVTISSKRVKGFRWFAFADNGDIANISVS